MLIQVLFVNFDWAILSSEMEIIFKFIYFFVNNKTKHAFNKWICFPSIPDDPRARGDSALRRGLPPPQTELPPEEDQEDQDSGEDDDVGSTTKV